MHAGDGQKRVEIIHDILARAGRKNGITPSILRVWAIVEAHPRHRGKLGSQAGRLPRPVLQTGVKNDRRLANAGAFEIQLASANVHPALKRHLARVNDGLDDEHRVSRLAAAGQQRRCHTNREVSTQLMRHARPPERATSLSILPANCALRQSVCSAGGVRNPALDPYENAYGKRYLSS